MPQDAPAEQEPQQVPRRLVGPVQVLQHEQQRGGLGHVGQQPGDSFEEPQPPVHVPHGVGPGTQQPLDHRMSGQGGGEPLVGGEHPQDLGERQIGQPDVPEIHAVPGDHRHSGVSGHPTGLVQQPGLAHPGVPGDQHGPGLAAAGTLQHTEEPGEFGVPSDNRRDK